MPWGLEPDRTGLFLLTDVPRATWVTPMCRVAGACPKVSGIMASGQGDGEGSEPRGCESYFIRGTGLRRGHARAWEDRNAGHSAACWDLLPEWPLLSFLQQMQPHWWSRCIRLGALYPKVAPTPCGARSVGAHPTTFTGLVRMGVPCLPAPSSDIKVSMTPGPSALGATPEGGEAHTCLLRSCPYRRAGREKGCVCADELPSTSRQALSSTSLASSRQMLVSISAPVVISIVPTPAGQSCWSLVSPCSTPPPAGQCWAGLWTQTVGTSLRWRGWWCMAGGAGHGDGEGVESRLVLEAELAGLNFGH